MSRIDYSKWDKLEYSSSSSEEEDDEKEKTQKVRATIANLSLSSSQRTSSSSSPLWNGLVLHHKDIFVSHVLPKLNRNDRYFFSRVNGESQDVLANAGVNVSELHYLVHECTSISTLEFLWNIFPWGGKDNARYVMDQAWFCAEVAGTNKLELLKWAREVKQCEWDEKTIKVAAAIGNLEMLKYCFSNDCPYDEKSCIQAAKGGHLDCLRLLFDKVKPSRDTEKEVAIKAAGKGHTDIVKYFVEERKISEEVKSECVYTAAKIDGHLNCLQYLVEEAKVPLDNWRYIASARYLKHHDCLNYLLEKGSPEPTEEEYDLFVEEDKLRFTTWMARMAGFPGF